MKKSAFEIYWRKRTVKAEETLMTINSIALTSGCDTVAEMVAAYFDSVAAGEVHDVKLSPQEENK